MDILRSAYKAGIGRDPEAGWNLLPLMAQLVREAATFVPALQVRRLGCESSTAPLLGTSNWDGAGGPYIYDVQARNCTLLQVFAASHAYVTIL